MDEMLINGGGRLLLDDSIWEADGCDEKEYIRMAVFGKDLLAHGTRRNGGLDQIC